MIHCSQSVSTVANVRKVDSHIKSLLKSFSWRVVATLTTGIIAYIITGSYEAAIAIGAIEFVIKFFVYYVHERVWERF